MSQNNGEFVCCYRVSTGKQGKSGLGLEAQREAVRICLRRLACLHRGSDDPTILARGLVEPLH
jgi:hypothetical protein